MIAVLTGDIISSRTLDPRQKWKKRLGESISKSGFVKPPKWDIFRGDGFQIELEDPSQALRVAILVTAGLRSMSPEIKLDARIAIGVGEKGYSGKSVNESNGEAYLLSGTLLDTLKEKNQRLRIITPWPEINKMNIAINLGNVIIDSWTFAAAQATWMKLSENATQEHMAKKLKISQPAVHKRLKIAHFDEFEELFTFFESEITGVTQNHLKA